jgi:hypothetical protein
MNTAASTVIFSSYDQNVPDNTTKRTTVAPSIQAAHEIYASIPSRVEYNRSSSIEIYDKH